MVEYQLDAMFHALGDPVRLAMVDQLSQGDATVKDLAGNFPISFQAVSKHIQILETAGLVSRSRSGRTRPVHLRAEALGRTTAWLDSRRRHLESRYERLDEVLAELPKGT